MKRKVLTLLSVLAVMFLMTACTVMEDFDITITKDGTVYEGITMALDNKTIDEMIASNEENAEENKTYSEEERWTFIEEAFEDSELTNKEGFTAERFESGEFKGKTFTGKIGNIADLSTEKEIEEFNVAAIEEGAKIFTLKDGVYTFKSPINSEAEQASTETEELPNDLTDALIVSLSMTLPYPAIENNATFVSDDKLTYTWDMTAKDVMISFMMEEPKEEAKAEDPVSEEVVEEKEEVKTPWANASKWAVEELTKTCDEGLIPTIFDAQDLTANITRKEFAHVAVRLYEKLSGSTVAAGPKNPFTDTEDQEVLKAYNIEITKGVTETTFEPDTLITREQMATMMTRALSAAGVDIAVDLEAFEHFADDAMISQYAKESVYFMAEKDIIKGVGNKTFDSKGYATREAALLIAKRSFGTFSGTNLPKRQQTATAGSNIPLKDNMVEAENQVRLTVQDQLQYIYGKKISDSRVFVQKVYTAEEEAEIASLKEMNLGPNEVAFEVSYDLKPAAKEYINELTIPNGEYAKESDWVLGNTRVGVLRPSEEGDGYQVTDFGTGW